MWKPRKEPPLPATDSRPKPGDFPVGSLESRAAARAMLERHDQEEEDWIRVIHFDFDRVRSDKPIGQTMLDGEVKFSRRIKGQVEGYYLFDMLYWDGTVIHTQKLFRRRPLVEIIYKDYFAGSDIVELARQVEVGKKTLYYESIDGELNEGIVLKKLDAIYPISYETNKTCTEWLKVKKVEKHVKCESGK